MLKTESTNRTYITNCISDLPIVYIATPDENPGIRIIMAPISEEQECKLEIGEGFNIETDRGTFHVHPDLCYAYGELDLSPNSSDINDMYNQHWFDKNHICIKLFTGYDYNTHTITSEIQGGRWYDTNNLKLFLPYLHGCIGKPQRIVIFKEYLSMIIRNKVKPVKVQTDYDYYKKNKDAIIERTRRRRAEARAKIFADLKFDIKIKK